MRVLGCFLCLIIITSFLQAQDQDRVQQIREELIQEMDQKLAKLRRELIKEIDQKLQAVKPAGYLGVSLMPITPGLRTLLDLGENEGVLVSKVIPGSPASDAGIHEMDIVLAINGQKVGDASVLQQAIEQAGADAEVELSILHKRNEKTIKVKLGKQLSSNIPQKKSDFLEELLGDKGMSPEKLKDMEGRLKRFLGELSPEDREMMENLQKQLEKQMGSLFKDPNFRKQMEKQFEDVLKQLGGKNPEDLLKDFLPKRQPQDKKDGKEKDDIDSLLDDLLKTEKSSPQNSSKAYLGITIIAIPQTVREKENFLENHGVLISEVAPDSPAAKAGLKKWDILLYIEKNKVLSVEGAKETLESFTAGDRTTLTVVRQGESLTFAVEFAKDKE